MREILFRGKRKDSDKWVEGNLICVSDFFCCILEKEHNGSMYFPRLVGLFGTIEGRATPIIPETVGQFTGLTDKNGKKIFEGDIVKLFLIDGEEIGVIKFNDILCRFCLYEKDGVYGFDKDCEFEVIGNIHDNPELLKGGAEK